MQRNLWKEVLLQDVADEITVGYVGPMVSEYVSEGIPFLRSQNVEPLVINQNDIKYITPEFHEKIRNQCCTQVMLLLFELESLVLVQLYQIGYLLPIVQILSSLDVGKN